MKTPAFAGVFLTGVFSDWIPDDSGMTVLQSFTALRPVT